MEDLEETLQQAYTCAKALKRVLRESVLGPWLQQPRELIPEGLQLRIYDPYQVLLEACRTLPNPALEGSPPSAIDTTNIYQAVPPTPETQKQIEVLSFAQSPPAQPTALCRRAPPSPTQQVSKVKPAERVVEYHDLPTSCQLLSIHIFTGLALEQVRELVRLSQEPANALSVTPAFSNNKLDWLVHNADWYRRLDYKADLGYLGTFLVRYHQVCLYRELESRRAPDQERNLPEDITSLADQCGLAKDFLKVQVGKGRLLDDVCGGHIGLLVFVPIHGLCDKAFSMSRHLINLRLHERAIFRSYQVQSRVNELLCVFGSEAMTIILHEGSDDGANDASHKLEPRLQ